MSTLADYTSPGLLIPRLQSRNATSVIQELCAVLEGEGRVGDRAAFYKAVLRREELSSTVTPSAWALPHARVPGLESLSFALGLSAESLHWFGNAPYPVHVVFLFAVPENEAAVYLRLISALAKLSRDPQMMKRLVNAINGADMFEVFGLIPLREPRAVALKD
jgi:mannitol/fructose-specific phosphotransferase system IIA component (Ntr-type)